MSNGVPMNQYYTAAEIDQMNAAQKLAGIEDPKDRMNTMSGMQTFASQLPAMNRIKERDNGRVVGRTSMMEGLGQMGSQLAGAYMQKNLMDRYSDIMKDNNKARVDAAGLFTQAKIDALRRAQAGAQPGGAQTFPVSAPNAPRTFPIDPYEVDGQYGG